MRWHFFMNRMTVLILLKWGCSRRAAPLPRNEHSTLEEVE